MRIINRSDIDCNKELWHAVAKALGLSRAIRDADFLDRKILVVVIHTERPRVGKERFLYGQHTLSRIDLYPCRVCTFGTLTITFFEHAGMCPGSFSFTMIPIGMIGRKISAWNSLGPRSNF